MPARVIRTRLRGTRELQRNLRLLGERAVPAAKAALSEEAERVMTASKGEVPVDTGNLRGTGHVAPPVVRARAVFVQAAYGGPAAPYALDQHERLDYRHPVGKAHYLIDPFNAARPGMVDRIAARVGEELLRGLP